MSRAPVTAEAIQRAIAGRISAGIYPAGQALPPLRRLAEELGANRNTVQKACRQLIELGMLAAPAGRRALVVRAAPPSSAAPAQLRSQVRAAVWEAMASGVPRAAAQAELMSLIEQIYGASEIRVRFLECNRYDSEQLGQELTRLIGTPISAGLTDELADPERLARDHDLIVTTFHHLGEVSRALVRHPELVVGVDTRPSPETLLGLARLPGARIGLVCTLADTARALRHLILSYRPGSQIEVALIEAPEEVRRLAAACDHLVVTHNCAPALADLVGRAPEVVVEFRIDAQSISYLRERVSAIRRARSAA